MLDSANWNRVISLMRRRYQYVEEVSLLAKTKENMQMLLYALQVLQGVYQRL